MRSLLVLVILCGWSVPAAAGEVEIVDAVAARSAEGTYTFDVTLRHDDEGEAHYADEWRVVGLAGTVYGRRELFHPHVDEQPFTRSLSGVSVPDNVDQVRIRAHDTVHGWSPDEKIIRLPN